MGMVGLVGPGVPTIPLPHIVEDVWRIVFFLLACAAIAHAAAFILIERARSMTVLMAAMLLGSNGVTSSCWASGAVTFATWLSGIF